MVGVPSTVKRRWTPWKLLIASRTMSNGTSSSSATAMTESALSTLWCPGIFTVNAPSDSPRRCTSKCVESPLNWMFFAR